MKIEIKSRALNVLILTAILCAIAPYHSFSQESPSLPRETPKEPAGEMLSPPAVPPEEKPVPKTDTPPVAETKVVPKIDKKARFFTLNFRDVDISEFVNIMSQLINKNIIIDEKVRGKITISSAKRIPVSQAYDIMKSILEVKGFAAVETENIIKIIPIQQAIKKNVEIITDGKKAVPSEEDKTITFLLDVEFADANEIANVMRSLKSAFVDVVVYIPLNTIIFSGTSSEIYGLVKIARALDKKLEALKEDKSLKGNIHVIHLENADAEQLANVLARVPFSDQAKIDTSPIMQTPQQPQTPPRSDMTRRITRTQPTAPQQKPMTKLSIIANKETNSLIITANPEEFREIYRIIKELDVVREQVFIEALIVEVSAEGGWELGIDWSLGNRYKSDHLYGGSSIMGSIPDYSTTTGNKVITTPLATGFQLGYLSDKSLLAFALLRASGTDSNFNVLSTPQILTVDNQEAELNVGSEIPVPTNNRISDTGVQFYTFEYKSVGVKLKITPHITKKDSITLDLFQEVNDVLGSTTVSTSGTIIPPELSKRDIKTKVTVNDGKTIVVGGLIRNNKSVEETKVPILGDIPLLGWFFKHRVVSNRKTNLLVFITPHVVTRADRLEAVTEQKREEQRRLKVKE